ASQRSFLRSACNRSNLASGVSRFGAAGIGPLRPNASQLASASIAGRGALNGTRAPAGTVKRNICCAEATPIPSTPATPNDRRRRTRRGSMTRNSALGGRRAVYRDDDVGGRAQQRVVAERADGVGAGLAERRLHFHFAVDALHVALGLERHMRGPAVHLP